MQVRRARYRCDVVAIDASVTLMCPRTALEAQLAEQSAANATLREQLQEQACHSQSIQENAEAETAGM